MQRGGAGDGGVGVGQAGLTAVLRETMMVENAPVNLAKE